MNEIVCKENTLNEVMIDLCCVHICQQYKFILYILQDKSIFVFYCFLTHDWITCTPIGWINTWSYLVKCIKRNHYCTSTARVIKRNIFPIFVETKHGVFHTIRSNTQKICFCGNQWQVCLTYWLSEVGVLWQAKMSDIQKRTQQACYLLHRIVRPVCFTLIANTVKQKSCGPLKTWWKDMLARPRAPFICFLWISSRGAICNGDVEASGNCLTQCACVL